MSAEITPWYEVTFGLKPTGRWLAGCETCNWWPKPYFDPDVARQDAVYHNHIRHDGHDVQAPNVPEAIVQHMVRLATRQMWLGALLSGGQLLFLALLMALLFGWTMMLAILISGFGVTYNAALFGKWAERKRDALSRREQLAAAIKNVETP